MKIFLLRIYVLFVVVFFANAFAVADEGTACFSMDKCFDKPVLLAWEGNEEMKDDAPKTKLDKKLIEAVNAGDVESVKRLISKGANVHVIGDVAAEPGSDTLPDSGSLLMLAAKSGNLEVVRVLIEKGLDVNARGYYYRNALEYAVINNDIPMIEYLIANGAQINVDGPDGGSPLSSAVELGSKEIIKLLIDKDAKINLPHSDGNLTVLHEAVYSGKKEIVQFLLDNGADPLIKDFNGGKTPLDFARADGLEEIVRIIENHILTHPSNVTAKKCGYAPPRDALDESLVDAVYGGFTACVREILNAGANANAYDNRSNSPVLVLAAKLRNFPAMREIVEKGADLKAVDKHYGMTALHYVIYAGDLKEADYLVKHGADVNESRPGIASPLMTASVKGNIALVTLLIKSGANVNAVDAGAMSALHLASKGGSSDNAFRYDKVVSLLLKSGADPGLVDGRGKTALDYAVFNKRTEAEKIIKKYLAGRKKDSR